MERSDAPANIADEAAHEIHTDAATQIDTGSTNGSTGSGQGPNSAALLTLDQINQRFQTDPTSNHGMTSLIAEVIGRQAGSIRILLAVQSSGSLGAVTNDSREVFKTAQEQQQGRHRNGRGMDFPDDSKPTVVEAFRNKIFAGMYVPGLLVVLDFQCSFYT